MDLEKFLSERLKKEQMEELNANSKLEKIAESKEDNKLTIILPSELVDMINSIDRGKRILRSNLVGFMRSLKSDLELAKDVANIDTTSNI